MECGRESLEHLAAHLEAVYGLHEASRRRGPVAEPLDVLIETVLSQATSDVNSRRAYTALRRRFATWDDVASAPVAEVAGAIAGGGLGPTKAARIKDIIARLRAERGRATLAFLHQVETEDALRYLEGLSGVGPKTAACVALFALGRPAFPVDTHVRRVCSRLGLVPAEAGAARAQELLGPEVPPERALGLHLLLIEHGRRACHPRRPACSSCRLAEDCRYARARAAGAARMAGAAGAAGGGHDQTDAGQYKTPASTEAGAEASTGAGAARRRPRTRGRGRARGSPVLGRRLRHVRRKR